MFLGSYFWSAIKPPFVKNKNKQKLYMHVYRITAKTFLCSCVLKCALYFHQQLFIISKSCSLINYTYEKKISSSPNELFVYINCQSLMLVCRGHNTKKRFRSASCMHVTQKRSTYPPPILYTVNEKSYNMMISQIQYVYYGDYLSNIESSCVQFMNCT